MYQYPYGNAQQLNLDWILSKLQELESGSGGGADLEEVANALVSASFDATIPYRKYDYAFYDGKLYRALNDNIGAFNPADWMEVTLGDDIPVLTRLVNADSALINTLQNQLQNLGSDDVANESTVTGNTVSDALGTLNGAINDKILYFTSQAVSATTGNILDISNAKITADYVLLECTFAAPQNITTKLTWTTSAGHFILNGTCTSATTANVTLGKKGN